MIYTFSIILSFQNHKDINRSTPFCKFYCVSYVKKLFILYKKLLLCYIIGLYVLIDTIGVHAWTNIDFYVQNL